MDLFKVIKKAPRPEQPFLRLLILWFDVIGVNVFFYFFLKALVFFPMGVSALWQIALWGILLILILYISHGLQSWSDEPSVRRLLIQLVFFLAFAAFVTSLSVLEATNKGTDWSWLRQEVIKVPLWLKMFIPMSPGFTGLVIVAVSLLMWLAITSPGSWVLRIIPAIAAIVLVWEIVATFVPIEDLPIDSTSSYPHKNPLLMIFLFECAGPLVLFCVLIWRRRFAMAFRIVPLAFHMVMIILNYMGILPIHSIQDILPLKTGRTVLLEKAPGLSMFYPPPGTKVDPNFLFLRKMILSKEELFVNYGPTCGIYAIDRQSRWTRNLPVNGLIREMQLAPDRNTIWALNWQMGDFLAIDIDSLSIQCERDLFDFNLATPYNMVIDGDRLFISNVTYPIVAQLSWEDPQDPCSLKLERFIDFHYEGFTMFTDGAFEMYLDRENDRLYVVIALLEGRNIGALVEIDLKTFQIARDVKLTCGLYVFPIEGRNNVLVPSYYNAELHEVSLTSMTVIRTIKAGPNVVSLEYDQRRGLFYALCRAPGLLQIIEDERGEVIKEVAVGAKPEPIWFDRETDQLFVGGGFGILQIDLKSFLGEAS